MEEIKEREFTTELLEGSELTLGGDGGSEVEEFTEVQKVEIFECVFKDQSEERKNKPEYKESVKEESKMILSLNIQKIPNEISPKLPNVHILPPEGDIEIPEEFLLDIRNLNILQEEESFKTKTQLEEEINLENIEDMEIQNSSRNLIKLERERKENFIKENKGKIIYTEEDERSKYMLKLKEDFWKEFEIMEKELRYWTLIWLPVFGIATTILPIYLVKDCEKGHNWLAHILEGILGGLLAVHHIYLGVKYKRKVERATPTFKQLDIQRFSKTLSSKIKGDNLTKFIFWEILTIMSYYDIYTDICFLTIAKASEDRIVWVIATGLMALTSLPRICSYIYYQITYSRYHKEHNNYEDIYTRKIRLHQKLFNLLEYLTAQELKAFSEPLREFARDHKILEKKDEKKDKNGKMKCLMWKTFTEDLPQLACQFTYVLLLTELCPDSSKVNPIIYISMLISAFMSITFTILAIRATSKAQIFRIAFRDAYYLMSYDHTLHQTALNELINHKLSIDNAIAALSKEIPTITSLHTLQLDNMQIGNKGAQALGIAIGQSLHITQLLLKGNKLNDKGAQYILKGMEANTNITYVDLEQNEIEENGLTKLINFNQKELKLRNLSENDILKSTSSDMYSIFECLKRWTKPALTHLSLELKTPVDIQLQATLGSLVSDAFIHLLSTATNIEYILISDQSSSKIMYQEIYRFFEKIGSAPKLNTLEISGVPLSCEDMRALSFGMKLSKSIRSLSLSSNELNEEGINELMPGIVSSCSIKDIKIIKNKFVDSISAGRNIGKALEENNSLEIFQLKWNGMKDEGAKLIQDGIKRSKNTNFMKAVIIDEDVKKYPLVIGDKATILNLNFLYSVNEGMFKIILENIMKNEVIERLDLSQTYFSEDQLGLLCGIQVQKYSLQYLSFYHGHITGEITTKHLGDMIAGTSSLHTLNLNHNQWMKDDVKYIIEGLVENHSLLKLDLCLCNIREEGIKSIGRYIGNNGELEQLILSKNRRIGEGIGYLGRALSENNKLFELDLSECNITEEGGRQLAQGLSHNKTLNTLNLGGNLCGDEGIVAIASAISLFLPISLLYLNLSGNGFGDLSLIELAQFMKITQRLQVLIIGIYPNYGGNTISENGAKYLCQGITGNKSRTLKHLDFQVEPQDLELSDSKGQLIEKAIKSHLAIETINLDGWNIPQERKDYIQEILQKRGRKMKK